VAKKDAKVTGIVLIAAIYVSHGEHDVAHVMQLNRNTVQTGRKPQKPRQKPRLPERKETGTARSAGIWCSQGSLGVAYAARRGL